MVAMSTNNDARRTKIALWTKWKETNCKCKGYNVIHNFAVYTSIEYEIVFILHAMKM